MRKKLIIFGIIFVVGIFIFTSLAVSSSEKKKNDDLYRQIRIFSDTLAIIQEDYADETKPKDLIYGALKGMLASLDPHSQFLDPESYAELKVDTQGRFGGLGIEITIKDGLLTVITPIEDTPAWKAGIKSNDRIVKINNELTRDITITDAVKKMRGRPGTTAALTVFRESEKKILDFKVIRAIIKIKDIKDSRILEDGIGYVRLAEFSENTPQDLNAALKNLAKNGMSAFILDLRNNPGGLLDVAVKVTEDFVENGKLIVSTLGRKDAQGMKFISRSTRKFDVPMVVLINEGSASGSEIVAGCLQDYKRAIIIGTKSFGKGSIQTVVPLSDGSALRLTTGKYFTPSNKQINGKGITPDIIVEEGKIEVTVNKAADFKGPDEVFEEVERKDGPAKQDKAKEYKKDNQLMRAVDILKAIRIAKQGK